MLLRSLNPPEPTEAPTDPDRLGHQLDQLYWRGQRLDAVARAAQTEVAAQEAELITLRARVAEQAGQIQRLEQTLRAAEAALVVKDRHIRRLRREMRVVQDYVQTVAPVTRARPDEVEKPAGSAALPLAAWTRRLIRWLGRG